MISLIAVVGRNRELGRDNALLWQVPGDLPRFKQITMGHPVIMGRRTYESIPDEHRPLKGRTNIVVTRDRTKITDDVVVVDSIEAAAAAAEKASGSEEVFVVGGGQIYEQTIDRADRLYLTVVDAEAVADTFFPDYSEFGKVVSEEGREVDGLKFRYVVLEKPED